MILVRNECGPQRVWALCPRPLSKGRAAVARKTPETKVRRMSATGTEN